MPGRKIKLGEAEKYGYSEEEWAALHKSKRWRIRNPGKQYAATKAWVENNRERRRAISRKYFLNRDYGITPEDYDIMLENQAGLCAICGTDKPTGKWKVFAVDHCHHTGKVRGLLCNECNRGMGLLGDNAERLRIAANYLECHNIKTQEERKK